MSWRERYQQASFRGVPFFEQSDERQGGGLVVLHKFPLRRVHYAEYLGPDIVQDSITGYVLGPDYDLARDRLQEALDKGGPGKLVHSKYKGSKNVLVLQYRISHSTAEGGKATFVINFVDAGERSAPVVTDNAVEQVQSLAAQASTASSSSFARRFNLAGPQWLRENAVALVNGATGFLRNINGTIGAAAGSIAEFSRDLNEFENEINTLILQPTAFASNLQSLFASARNLIVSPRDAFRQLRKFFDDFGDDAPAISQTTPSRMQEAENQAALIGMIKESALTEALQSTVSIPFDSTSDAQATQDSVVDAIDEIINMEDPDDGVVGAMLTLRNSVIKDINRRGINLPRVMTYIPPVTMPVQLIAWKLYGSTDLVSDIIARNRIRHPGFVAAGTVLEVLSNAP